MAELALAEHVNTIVNLSDTVASRCLQYPHEVQKAEDVVRLKIQVKELKATLSEVQQVLKGPNYARISASWNAIEAIGKCSTRFEYLKTKLVSALESMSSSESEARWPFSREDLDESIKELSTSNQALAKALQSEQILRDQLNHENLINRLNSASSFRHHSISPKKEIRLIRFSTSDTSDCEPKSDRISLEMVPLTSNQKYQALSYTWGDPNDPQKIRRITINKEDFFITGNLDTALRHLHTQFGGKDVLLWVDAVCINQLNTPERNYQVSMMGDIYKSAELVLIWLGPAFQNSPRAMEAIKKLGKRGTDLGFDKVCLSFEAGFTSWDDITSLIPSATEFQSDTTPRMTEDEIIVSDDDSASLPLSPIVALAEREWWERVWVLQELAVAKKADFICGNNRVSLEHFVAAIRFLISYLHIQTKHLDASGQYKQIKEMENLSYVVNRKLSRTYFFFYLRREYHHQQHPQLERKGLFLEDLLGRTCGFLRSEQSMKATNPRDRVYAILGLLSKEAQLKIEVDYAATCDSVYTKIAKALLSNGPRVLSFCRFPKNIEKLPSWVPDWSASNKDERYWKWDGILDSSKAFSTSGSSVFEWNFQSENRTLKIKGRDFDKIEKVVDEGVQNTLISNYNEHQRRYDQEGSAAKELSLRNVCIAAQTYLTVMKDFTAGGEIYPSEDAQDDAVWKTAIADMILRSSDREHTRSQNDTEEAEKLRVAYRTVLNGYAYEDDAMYENRIHNRHLYQHIHEEGVVPHLVPELEDYFDNALPWTVNMSKLLEDNPTLFQDMERKILEPDFRLGPEKKEMALAGVRHILGSERGLMETLLPPLGYIICKRMEAGDVPSMLYLQRFTPTVFLHLVGARSIGRRAFHTSNGYLGLGPQDLRSGDHVVIVHGSTVPFILRKIDKDKFTLIGEAYVHGIMDGEGMTDETQPDDFILC